MKMNFSKMIMVAASTVMLGGGLISTHVVENPIKKIEGAKEGAKEGQEALGYLNWMREKYTNPNTGTYDYDAIVASRESLNKFRANAKATRAFPTMDWVERGPNNVGGRTRAVLIDKNNSNKLYAATAGGGLFVSTNCGDTWNKHPQSDTFQSLQGSGLAQSVNGDIYFSTGEYSYGGSGSPLIEGGSALPGDGIFKSSDGGATFVQLQKTRPTTSGTGAWAYITKVVCDPTNNDIVYAATTNGLKKSVDGGSNWTNMPTVGTATISDFEIVPNGNMIVGTIAGVYVSTNGGTSFQSKWGGANGSGLPTTPVGRMEVSYAPTNPNHIYLVAIKSSNYGLCGVYESVDFGATWTTIINGGGTFEPFGTPPPNQTFQGFWDVALATSPFNENEFYIGGMQDLYRYTPATQFKSIAYWQGSEALGQEIHSDMHHIVYDPAVQGRMFVSTDGGVYKSNNADAVTPMLAEKNDGLTCLQNIQCDANFFDKLISGSQDNGTTMMGFDANSKLHARKVYAGDGGICALSDIFSDVAFGSTSYRSDMARSVTNYPTYATFHNSDGSGISIFDVNVDGGYTWNASLGAWLGGSQDGRPDDQAQQGAIWSMPMDFRENKNPSDTFSVMVIGTVNNMWFTQKVSDPTIPVPIWFNLANVKSMNNYRFTAVHISKDGTNIYGATSGGRIIRVSGIDLFNKSYEYINESSLSRTWNKQGIVVEDLGVQYSATITSIATDQSSGELMVVTTSNYGGTSNYVTKIDSCKSGTLPRAAVSIVNNLPMMPVNSAVFVPATTTGSTGKNRIILGTESGVWGSDNGGNTWAELNNMGTDPTKWHPRVPVAKVIIQEDLYSHNGPIVYTGTHGRGMFCSYTMATAYPTSTKNITKSSTLNIYPNPAVDNIIAEMNASSAAQAFVQIVNMSGAVVNSFHYSVLTGINKININTSNLPKGAYFVSIIANGERMVNTIVKQ
jgi:photosystem II stability/assembly factor-like uncharacterized protein